MIRDLEWQQPAILGGLIVGILSAIPGISALNCCFCAWAVIGGLVASRMLINRSPRRLKSSDGVEIGLYAGLIGAAAFILISVPIVLSGVATRASLQMMESLMSGISNPEVQEVLSNAMAEASSQGPAKRLLTSLPFLFVQAVVQGGFAILGGMLGIYLFEKRKDVQFM